MDTEIVHLPMSLKELSHELRTPLAGILGMVEQLNAEPLTPQQKNYIKDIREAGMSLLKLADRLLETQRLAVNYPANKMTIQQWAQPFPNQK